MCCRGVSTPRVKIAVICAAFTKTAMQQSTIIIIIHSGKWTGDGSKREFLWCLNDTWIHGFAPILFVLQNTTLCRNEEKSQSPHLARKYISWNAGVTFRTTLQAHCARYWRRAAGISRVVSAKSEGLPLLFIFALMNIFLCFWMFHLYLLSPQWLLTLNQNARSERIWNNTLFVWCCSAHFSPAAFIDTYMHVAMGTVK